jgi:L-ascorbate metabolism protein UlaG (beta-lactamase superfamily)
VRGFIDELGRDIRTPKAPRPNSWDANAITATWLGHASVLVNFYGFTILTDPALMQRIGANFGLGTIGPKRLIAPALRVGQLPKIDLVLLSHAHFDHFDMPTLKALPRGSKAVTAKNTGDLLAGTSLKGAAELSWGRRRWSRRRAARWRWRHLK